MTNFFRPTYLVSPVNDTNSLLDSRTMGIYLSLEFVVHEEYQHELLALQLPPPPPAVKFKKN